MPTIKTTFLPPTDSKPARVKAACDAGSVTISWDDAYETKINHQRAAEALCAAKHWDTDLVGSQFSNAYYWNCDDGRLKALKGFVNSMRQGTWSGSPWGKSEFRKCVEAIGRSYDPSLHYLDVLTEDVHIKAYLANKYSHAN